MAYYPYWYFITPEDGGENISVSGVSSVQVYLKVFTTPTFDFGTNVSATCSSVEVTTDVPSDAAEIIYAGPTYCAVKADINSELDYSTEYSVSWSLSTDIGDFNSPTYTFTTEAEDGGSVPSAPINPTPEHEATGITLDDTIITWEDGGGGETYDVYFRPYGEFFEKIASDITDTFVDAIVAHTVAYNGHYTYGELYLWCVIAKNEYGSNYDPPTDFGIGYGGTIWEFNAMVFDPPLPSGVTLSYAGDDDGVPTGTPTGENNMMTKRGLVAAANDRIWYEDI